MQYGYGAHVKLGIIHYIFIVAVNVAPRTRDPVTRDYDLGLVYL